MTRPIRPHKGGRTCTAPSARMTPQERERLDAVLEQRGVKHIDWYVGHVEADYAEITQGDDRMVNTEDLAAGILGMTGPYSASLIGATSAIDRAIAAAVQAEREANRVPLEDAARQLKAVAAYANTLPKRYAAHLSAMIQYGDIEAAAIRARNNGSR